MAAWVADSRTPQNGVPRLYPPPHALEHSISRRCRTGFMEPAESRQMPLEIRPTCFNPPDRDDYCALARQGFREVEVGRLFRDDLDSRRRWQWRLYWYFQPGRVGPFVFEQTLAEAIS